MTTSAKFVEEVSPYTGDTKGLISACVLGALCGAGVFVLDMYASGDLGDDGYSPSGGDDDLPIFMDPAHMEALLRAEGVSPAATASAIAKLIAAASGSAP